MTTVPGLLMAEKSRVVMCWPLACVVALLAGGLDEQALIPVTAATASTPAAIRWDQDRVGCIWMGWLLGGEGVSEVWVDGLEGEPSAGEVAGVEPFG